MTPLKFERLYGFDERACRGGYFSSSPVHVEEGDRVGVVLLASGGPSSLDDVESFLYNLLMDPVRVSLPVSGRLRHWFCSALARYRAGDARTNYELIGGGTPMIRLVREQAECLRRHLDARYGSPTGVDIRVYGGMRYGSPSIEEAATQMEEEGVDKVVLLPLYPQYAQCTSGSVLAYWKAMIEAEDLPDWPTTSVGEYAANPRYVQALSERIDEGLQRFSRDRRGDVPLLFSAHGVSRRERDGHRDPYCCLVHDTVEQVMALRGTDRSFRTAFREGEMWEASLSPSTTEALESLAEEGNRSVLVVPISFVADHYGTYYTLDIEARESAKALGFERYEVTSGLNTHPLLIEALGEVAAAQLALPVDVNQLRVGGDGASQTYELYPPSETPRYDPERRTVCCGECSCVAGARRWVVDEKTEPDAVPPEGQPASSTVPTESAAS